MAILSEREGLEFEEAIESDTAPLHTLVAAMPKSQPQEIRCLRDPTRGVVATILNETAASSGGGIRVEENQIPVKETVKGVTCLDCLR